MYFSPDLLIFHRTCMFLQRLLPPPQPPHTHPRTNPQRAAAKGRLHYGWVFGCWGDSKHNQLPILPCSNTFSLRTSCGRQGLFVHDNTHHALYMARAAVACLRDDGSFDERAWQREREIFETHVVED